MTYPIIMTRQQRLNCFSPSSLTLLLIGGVGVTPVQFKHVDAPVSKRLRINLHRVQSGPRVPAARVCAHVSIDAQFQATVVKVTRQLIDATRKPADHTVTSHEG